MQKAKDIAAVTFMGLTGSLVFLYFFLNLILGCETWDQTQWTDWNQCVTPSQFVEMLLPL